MPRLVNAAVDSPSQVLDERAVEPRINLPDAKIPVDHDARGCHWCTTPSSVAIDVAFGSATGAAWHGCHRPSQRHPLSALVSYAPNALLTPPNPEEGIYDDVADRRARGVLPNARTH